MARSSNTLEESSLSYIVVFELDERRFAVRLSAAEQIVRVVAVTPLPQAPAIVLGVVNIRGRIVPVFRIRERFRLPEKEIELSDHLIVARTSRRVVAFVADRATDVVAFRDEDMTDAEEILPGLDHVAGVVKLENGLVFVHDLDTFLSGDEEKTLEQAMSAKELA